MNRSVNILMFRRMIVPIRGDGNCLFRSVSYCIYGHEEKHREIRIQVVDRVVNNWSRYKGFIIGDLSYGLPIRQASDYRRLMSRNGEYAGHVELHCVCEIYTEFTFVVHRTTSARSIKYGHGRFVKHLLFSGFLDAGHYNVLRH